MLARIWTLWLRLHGKLFPFDIEKCEKVIRYSQPRELILPDVARQLSAIWISPDRTSGFAGS